MAGGGAASPLIEELVLRGFTPTVGIVSVFDTDYETAQVYGLEVVSAPPFEPFPEQAMADFDGLVRQADVIVVAPVFFGRGNLAPLRAVVRLARGGTKVIVVDRPPSPSATRAAARPLRCSRNWTRWAPSRPKDRPKRPIE